MKKKYTVKKKLKRASAPKRRGMYGSIPKRFRKEIARITSKW